MKLDCTAEIRFGASLKWPLQELQYLQYQMDTDLVQTTIETIASIFSNAQTDELNG